MKVVRSRDLMASAAKRIPPGAYVSKFYHHDLLTVSESGHDVHVTGARLIQLIVLLVTSSTTGDVVIEWLKNGELFRVMTIPEGEYGLVAELSPVETSISMDFEAIIDRLQISITNAGVEAASLTALGVFDR